MDEKIQIMTTYPIKKAVRILAFPTMLAMLVQIIYNMTDSLFVGMLNDTSAITAMNVAFPIFMSLQILGQIFGNGGASYISRLLGKENYKMANRVASIAFFSTVLTSMLAMVTCLYLMDDLLVLSGVSPFTYDQSKSYLSIITMGSVFISMQLTLSALLRSEGATKKAMIGMLMGTIANVILDPIMIFGLGLGINGAALATVIGYLIGFLYFWYQYKSNQTLVKIEKQYYLLDLEIYKEVIIVGLPSSINLLLISVSNILVINVAVSYNTLSFNRGDQLLAAYGISNRISMIIIMLVNGLALGSQSLIGFSYGRNDLAKVKKVISYILLMASLMSFVGAVVIALSADFLIAAFIREAYTAQLGVKLLRTLSISLPFIGLQMVAMVVFQSLGKGFKSSLIALGRQGIFFIPTLFILNRLFLVDGFIFAQPVASILTALMAFVFLKQLDFELKLADKNTIRIA